MFFACVKKEDKMENSGNSMENRVSIESPIGKALKGHKVGDRVKVQVNENVSYYLKIRSIDKTGDEGEDIRSF